MVQEGSRKGLAVALGTRSRSAASVASAGIRAKADSAQRGAAQGLRGRAPCLSVYGSQGLSGFVSHTTGTHDERFTCGLPGGGFPLTEDGHDLPTQGRFLSITGTLAARQRSRPRGAGVAATSTILIRSSRLRPGSLTVNHGDKVVFKKQTRSTIRSSPTTAPSRRRFSTRTQSWTTAALNTACNFRDHDALHPSLTGRVIVKQVIPGGHACPFAADC